MKAIPVRSRWLASIVVVLFMSISVAACTAKSDVDPPSAAESPSIVLPNTVKPSLAQLPAGTTAFELKVVSAGESLRRALLEPAPVGSMQQLEVRIEQPGSWVSAIVEVLVERSSADGSSDTLIITGLEFSASDQALADSLKSNLGASLRMTRGPNRVVEEYGSTLNRDGSAIEVVSISNESFWLGQLLRAPVTFAGPIPAGPVGQGAVWEVTFQDDADSRTTELNTLTRLNLDRYVIEVRPVEQTIDSGSRPQSILLEGQVGQVLPDRQEIVIADLTITVKAVS